MVNYFYFNRAMVHIWDVNWLGIKFQFQPLYGMFTNLRYHLGAPVPPPYIPSHSKWTHNCRSSGETVTNCRESPIYDVSSEQPLQHLFLGRRYFIFRHKELKQQIGWTLYEKREKIKFSEMRRLTSNALLYYFTISEAGLATFYDHCRSFNTALYDPCISPTLNSWFARSPAILFSLPE